MTYHACDQRCSRILRSLEWYNSVLTFRDNLSAIYLRVKVEPWRWGTKGFTQTYVQVYSSTLREIAKELKFHEHLGIA